MLQLPELEANLKFMTQRWRAPSGVNPEAELDEYRRVWGKLDQSAVRRVLEQIKANKTGREWPTPAEVRRDAEQLPRKGKGQGPETWEDLQRLWDQRWGTADRLLREYAQARRCPQIAEALDLGFWRQYRAVARRVLWERQRDNIDVDLSPLLSDSVHQHIKDKHLGEVAAVEWQTQHLAENGGKYRSIAK